MGAEGNFNSPRRPQQNDLVPDTALTLKGLEAMKSRIEIPKVDEVVEVQVPGNLTAKQEEELGETVRSLLENR